jgi:hypothetical protein
VEKLRQFAAQKSHESVVLRALVLSLWWSFLRRFLSLPESLFLSGVASNSVTTCRRMFIQFIIKHMFPVIPPYMVLTSEFQFIIKHIYVCDDSFLWLQSRIFYSISMCRTPWARK